MTKSTFYTASTLDGFLADENDSLDWLFRQDQDQRGPMNYDEFFAGIGTLVMGSTTYQWLLDHEDAWPRNGAFVCAEYEVGSRVA